MAKKNNENKTKKQKNSYFKEMRTELKKVTWPTPKELINNTVGVIAFVLIIAIIVFILDFCFDNLNKYGITKLQNTIQSSLKVESNESNSTDENSLSDSNEENEENQVNAEETTNIETTENSDSETENTNSNSEE